jgi:hypothetical protein
MIEELDNPEDFEARETARKLPIGWLILFWGLILFGIVYTVMYTPGFGGWSQEKAYTDTTSK